MALLFSTKVVDQTADEEHGTPSDGSLFPGGTNPDSERIKSPHQEAGELPHGELVVGAELAVGRWVAAL